MSRRRPVQPIGAFVHHQGRGHAERIAALARALEGAHPMVLFCARGDAFASLPSGTEVIEIPSLFEAPGGTPPAMDDLPTPATLHCAPVGWPTIRRAVAQVTGWLDRADPALFVTDVSAEMAQVARIASVPTVCVLQHGDRSDAGHVAAYEGAAGLLAPYAAALEQPERPGWMRARTHHAAGIGVARPAPLPRDAACRALGLDPARPVVAVISGGGGGGIPLAPLTMGARARPDAQWVVAGQVAREWHETVPGNLRLDGWTDGVDAHLAAADAVCTSAGNTLCHQVLALGRPWLVVPEWRYFDEQAAKAEALARAGAAHVLPRWPGTPGGWIAALDAAARLDASAQRALFDADAARGAADWLAALAARLWAMPAAPSSTLRPIERLHA